MNPAQNPASRSSDISGEGFVVGESPWVFLKVLIIVEFFFALLIGVADDGAILGLKQDMSTLPKRNVDGFKNIFNMAFNRMIGVEYRQFVDVSFPRVADETICLVSVRPSTEPAYLTYQGKEEFYVRAGNASQPLSVSKATRYIQGHFGSS